MLDKHNNKDKISHSYLRLTSAPADCIIFRLLVCPAPCLLILLFLLIIIIKDAFRIFRISSKTFLSHFSYCYFGWKVDGCLGWKGIASLWEEAAEYLSSCIHAIALPWSRLIALLLAVNNSRLILVYCCVMLLSTSTNRSLTRKKKRRLLSYTMQENNSNYQQ